MEYWITGKNKYIYCDGDVENVPNHECAVISHCLQEISQECLGSSVASLQEFGWILTQALQESIVDHPMLRENINNWIDQSNLPESDAADIYDWLIRNGICKEKVGVAFFNSARPIDYAIERLGWVRVKMYDGVCNINLWNFDRVTRNMVGETLYEIFGDRILNCRCAVEITSVRKFIKLDYREL